MFDTDANEQNRAFPTVELCTADNPLGDDIPVMMRSSSPVIRARIEGFEKLSQSKDDFPVVRKSESVNPARFPARGETFSSGTSHVKSQ